MPRTTAIRCVAASALLFLGNPVRAETPTVEAAPLLTPRPVFVPGLYETESRNSQFQDQGAKGEACLASADYESFRRETMAQYQSNPRFLDACRLSETRDLPDGFVFAMACKESKVVLTYHFSKDSVTSTIQTLITRRPEFSSEILTLMRRRGDCPGREKPGRNT